MPPGRTGQGTVPTHSVPCPVSGFVSEWHGRLPAPVLTTSSPCPCHTPPAPRKDQAGALGGLCLPVPGPWRQVLVTERSILSARTGHCRKQNTRSSWGESYMPRPLTLSTKDQSLGKGDMSILASGFEVGVCNLCAEPGQRHRAARPPVALPRASASCALEGTYITLLRPPRGWVGQGALGSAPPGSARPLPPGPSPLRPLPAQPSELSPRVNK